MLRIEPGLPLAWTSPTTVRIGIQRAVAIVEDVDDDMAEMLERLRRGVLEAEPEIVLGEERATRLLAAVAPALERHRRPRMRVHVLGVGTIAESARSVLDLDGHTVSRRTPDLTVAVADWRLPEPQRQRLLHRDAPHLTVTIGDERVDVGPYTVPGASACSRCAALADEEAFVPFGLPALDAVPAATIAQTIATIATTVNRIAAGTLDPGAGRRIDVRTGEVSDVRWLPVEACGCRALPGTSTASAPSGRRRAHARGAASDAPA